MEDPMEAIIAQALTAAGVGFTRDLGGKNPSGLDFRLDSGIEIEVKRFHSPRIADQMSRVENVIVLQGEQAIRHYASLITPHAKGRMMEKIIQMDRDAAANLALNNLTFQHGVMQNWMIEAVQPIRDGQIDDDPSVQSFAAYRMAVRAHLLAGGDI